MSGGFSSGKTYVACQKIIFLLLAYRRYRTVIARQVFQDLKKTTISTFFKLLPPKLIQTWNSQDGYLKLTNGSEVFFMHLDTADEQSLRGLETNSVYIDQPEEISEGIYGVLDARMDRWDQASLDDVFAAQFNLTVQKDRFNRNIIPHYMLLTPNPDVETHWIWRYYHPDSDETRPDHTYYEVASTENPYTSPETLKVMLSRDPSWVKRFVYGQWGISEAAIHVINKESILDLSKDQIVNILKKSNLYRAFDHGEASPSCCLWFANYRGAHICYREYYQPAKTVSYHRSEITSLSKDSEGYPEHYVQSVADPQIFKMTQQKYGGFWSVAQEYLDPELGDNTIAWIPADNNELATRNRINETLQLSDDRAHIITGERPAPGIYFIKRNLSEHEYGVDNVIKEIRGARRKKLGEINGKAIYSDEREDSPDHAYDAYRYYNAVHSRGVKAPIVKASETSFLAARNRLKALKKYNIYNKYGDRQALFTAASRN